MPQLLGSNPDSISQPPPSTPLVTHPVLPSACSHATLNWGEGFSNWCSFDGIFSGSTNNVRGKLKRKMLRAAWSPLLSSLSKLLVKKRCFLLCSLHTRDFLYLECLLWTGFLRWENNSCHTHLYYICMYIYVCVCVCVLPQLLNPKVVEKESGLCLSLCVCACIFKLSLRNESHIPPAAVTVKHLWFLTMSHSGRQSLQTYSIWLANRKSCEIAYNANYFQIGFRN